MLWKLAGRAAPAGKHAAAGPRARTLSDMVKSHRAGGSSGARSGANAPDMSGAWAATRRAAATPKVDPSAAAAAAGAARRSKAGAATAARVGPGRRASNAGSRAKPTTTTPASSGRMGRFAKGAAIGGAAAVGGAWATNTGPGSTPGNRTLYRKPPGGGMM